MEVGTRSLAAGEDLAELGGDVGQVGGAGRGGAGGVVVDPEDDVALGQDVHHVMLAGRRGVVAGGEAEDGVGVEQGGKKEEGSRIKVQWPKERRRFKDQGSMANEELRLAIGNWALDISDGRETLCGVCVAKKQRGVWPPVPSSARAEGKPDSDQADQKGSYRKG